MRFDTIAAIATAPGPAGIAVIRISGPNAATITGSVIRTGASRRPLILTPKQSHRLFYGRAINPVTGIDIDEVMVGWMAAPRSFTTEDVAEIGCHGGEIASGAVLRALLAAGARHADPGEFTFRAFMHGRLDLTQAESVLQVVSAQTADGLERALADLGGDLGKRIAPARQAVISALAYLDAAADFPDDEIPVSNVAADLANAEHALADVLAGAKSGRLLTDGATVALIGRPNVGKSSLLNALLRSDRAIVTPVAGTTRDVVSERAVLDGIPVTLLDTAGLTETIDPVEQLGVDRSRSAISHAAALVIVLDATDADTAEDRQILGEIRARFDSGATGVAPYLIARNKADLITDVIPSPTSEYLRETEPVVDVSALTGFGLVDLERAIADAIRIGVEPSARPSLLSERQHAEIDRALLHIREARAALDEGFPTDLLATDVRLAARSLGRITGEDIDDAVLAEIFSRFCIGK